MSMAAGRIGILLAAAAVLGAQSSDELLRRIDRFRYPWPAFTVDVGIQDGKTQQAWRVLVRENGDARVEGLSDKEKGRTVLLLGDQMWLLLPTAKHPVKVSPQQRLMGPAAGGDIARFRFAGDYRVLAEKEDTLDGAPARRLDLQAEAKNLSYQRASLWLNAERQPLRAEYYYASGKLARTAAFGPVEPEHGAQVLRSLDLEEPSGRKVKLTFTRWRPATPDEHAFQLPE